MVAKTKPKKKTKDISYKTIIIGKPRSDLAKKIAKDPNTEVVSPNTTVTSLLKKYGSDKNLYIYSHGFVYTVDISGWCGENYLDCLSKTVLKIYK